MFLDGGGWKLVGKLTVEIKKASSGWNFFLKIKNGGFNLVSNYCDV
jgi:hypothetical protein